jgi:hypothetical protein
MELILPGSDAGAVMIGGCTFFRHCLGIVSIEELKLVAEPCSIPNPS